MGPTKRTLARRAVHAGRTGILDPYDVLTTKDQRAVEDERAALEAFHAP